MPRTQQKCYSHGVANVEQFSPAWHEARRPRKPQENQAYQDAAHRRLVEAEFAQTFVAEQQLASNLGLPFLGFGGERRGWETGVRIDVVRIVILGQGAGIGPPLKQSETRKI